MENLDFFNFTMYFWCVGEHGDVGEDGNRARGGTVFMQ